MILSGFAQMRGVGPGVRVFAKAEWCNPGGSVKARAALRMVEDAERSGALQPGKIIIDSSSGNTGIALALIGAVKGYAVHLVMPANVSSERKALVRAFGATLVESDPLEGADGAMEQVRKLVARDPARYYYTNQYNNPANWLAHYSSTGPEIWQQTAGKVTHFVAGLGTTGTFVGTGRFLRECNARVETIGIGGDMAWQTVRDLARQAGIFVGVSAGAAVAASIAVGRTLERGQIVTILPDDGSKYVSLGVYDQVAGGE